MMHEDGQETEPKNRHASHARTGTMSLTYRKPGEKTIATEKAPGAGIGESWGGSKDGSITFVKNDGEGGGAWYEVAASVCCRTQSTKAEERAGGPGLIRGLHLVQGLTVKGARPAVRLTLDGHFPREPG